MTHHTLNKYGMKAASILVLTGLLAGCSVDDFVEYKKENKVTAFDFRTQENVYLRLSYGEYGSKIVFNVYSENPSFNEEAKPVFSAFADENGHYEGDLLLPTSADKVWIRTEAWGLPNEAEVPVIGNDIVCDLSSLTATPKVTKPFATRASGGNDYSIVTLVDAAGNTSTGISSNMAYMRNLYSIVKWWDLNDNLNQYGQITDFNNLVDETLDAGITPDQITDVQYRLWGGVSKPTNLNNSSLAQYDHINTKVQSGTQLHFTFVDENGWYESSIGYYYYKTGETVKSWSEMKKYIIFPNASKAANAPYGIQGHYKYASDDAPLVPRTRIKLLFEDEEGNVSDLFPAGYTVGFFIIPDGFCNNGGKIDVTPASGRHSAIDILTTDPQMFGQGTSNYNAGLRFMSLQMGDRIFYGVEDGKDDQSYDDVLWTVDATTPNAIYDNDRKPVSSLTEVTDVTTSYSSTTTYAYEDIWPGGGDYDLNDVIVELQRTITVGKANGDTKQKMRKVVDDYHVVTPYGAADDASAFVILYDKNYVPEFADSRAKLSIEFSRYSDMGRGEIFPVECVDEYEDGNGNMAYILFEDGRYEGGWHFVVEREWKGNYHDTWYINNSTEGKGLARPFIISRYGTKSTKETGYTEIHLPGDKVTGRAKATSQGEAAYYIGMYGRNFYPYAIEIPKGNFTPSPEKMNIGNFYPHFNSWAESQGKNNTDWYSDN